MAKSKKELNKEELIERFKEYMQYEVYIECTACGIVEGDFEDDGLANDLIQNGWKLTKKNCYCPKCAKKYLNRSVKTKQNGN